MDLEQLKAPIGRFEKPDQTTSDHIEKWINDIASFPQKVADLTKGLDEELNWSYRPGGWTVAQIVHHCADSHLNSLIRFKWALTEDTPTIKAYDENAWIKLADAQGNDLQDSISLIRALHKKWVTLLTSMTDEQLNRMYQHPDKDGLTSVSETIGQYAWHCNHHFAQMLQAIAKKGQFH